MITRIFSAFEGLKTFFDQQRLEKNSNEVFSMNQQRLIKIDFPLENIPEEFLCKITHEIMIKPINLDNHPDHVVDEENLYLWWKNYKRHNINPFTMSPLRKPIELNAALQNEIEIFILTRELEAIRNHIDSIAEPYTFAACLLMMGTLDEDIPKRFIDSLLSKSIMNFPVKMDDEQYLDFFTLQRWWQENPHMNLCNPYTFVRLKKIEFDQELFSAIKQFILKDKVACNQKKLDSINLALNKNNLRTSKISGYTMYALYNNQNLQANKTKIENFKAKEHLNDWLNKEKTLAKSPVILEPKSPQPASTFKANTVRFSQCLFSSEGLKKLAPPASGTLGECTGYSKKSSNHNVLKR